MKAFGLAVIHRCVLGRSLNIIDTASLQVKPMLRAILIEHRIDAIKICQQHDMVGIPRVRLICMAVDKVTR